ncbi:ADP/ATP carrier protein [Rhizina undulata]
MTVMSKEAALPSWGYALAGATGAVLANAAVYPLDIVKTKLQVQVKRKPDSKEPLDPNEEELYQSTLDAILKIHKKSGVQGLYNGMFGALIGVASTNFAYFYWYTIVRTFYLKRSSTTSLSTPVELSLGAVAGALAQLFTIPVAVVTTRQQTRPYSEEPKGLIETAKEVIAEDGPSGLWRGLKASLVLVVNPAITYGCYQRLREMMFKGKTRISPGEAFLLGAMSKSLATLATQPLIVAKVGLQSRPPPGRKQFKSFLEVMAYIIEQEGPMKLFKGIGPQLTKGLLVQGLLMMTKERMELIFILLFRALKKLYAEKRTNRA